jgi:hypothetical protein
LQKVKALNPLIIVIIISALAITIFSVGLIQNNTSIQSSQKNGFATYTGYLMSESTCWYPVRNLDHPYSVSSNLVSLTFADGRIFTENETLAESQNVTAKAKYMVLYNLTDPNTAIQIVNLP